MCDSDDDYELAEREDGKYCDLEWFLTLERVRHVISWMFRMSVEWYIERKYGRLVSNDLAPIVFQYADSEAYPIGHWVISRSHDTSNKVVLSSDGRWLRIGDSTGVVTNGDLFSFTEGDRTQVIDNRICAIACRNGIIATQSRDSIIIWKSEKRVLIHKLKLSLSEDDRPTMEFNFTAEYLISGGTKSRMRLWSMYTGKCIQLFDGYSTTISAAKFIGSNCIVAVSEGRTKVWDSKDGRCLEMVGLLGEGVQSLSVNSNESLIAAVGRKVYILEWPSMNVSSEISPVFSDCAVFHPIHPNLLAVGCNDGTVRMYDVCNGECIHRFYGHGPKIAGVFFTPDGSRSVSVGSDGSIRMRDMFSDDCQVLQRYVCLNKFKASIRSFHKGSL